MKEFIKALKAAPNYQAIGIWGGYFMERGGEMTGKEGTQEWYSNKDLYEMMVDLSKGLEQTNAELAKTQTMIRDYNGLRGRLDGCEKRLDEICGQSRGSKDLWGYIVGGFGVLMAIVSLAVR